MANNGKRIIKCRGMWINGKRNKCDFTHIGKWGDDELYKHQDVHEKEESKHRYWLGFDEESAFKRERSSVNS